MKKYKYLFWDIDGTVLNFLAAEKAAIQTLFRKHFSMECSDEMIESYSSINVKYWQMLERNEMTKEEILVNRFKEFFLKEGLDVSKAEVFNSDYQLALGDTIVFCDESDKLLKKLSQDYILCAVSNGTKTAQTKKLQKSGLDKIFDYIFISEIIGIEKPNKGFFETVEKTLSLKNREEVLMIGDSLTSDIKGGNNMSYDTCWYNPYHKNKDCNVSITYEIHDLHEILSILQ